MKSKITSGLIVNVIIGVALGLMFLSWAFLMFPQNNHGTVTDDQGFMIINNLPPLTPPVSDSIPYYQHQRLQDSVIQLRTLHNGDGPNTGSAASLGLFGTQFSNYCDTCSVSYQKNNWPTHFEIDKKPKQSYFVLSGWKLGPGPLGSDSIKFHVEHGQAYLRKAVIDSTRQNKNGPIERIAHIRDVKVSFGYNRGLSCITIPINSGTKDVLDKVFIVIAILLFLYYMFFVVGGFVKFLIDVARGRTFTEKNIRRLKIIGISLIAFETLMFLSNLCMPLIFHSYFTCDVVLSEKSWDGSWKWLMAGVTFLLLYKAFRSGKRIQDEQDLVI